MQQTTRQLMSMAAYARSRDLNRSTISRAVKDGQIPTHGEQRLIDPEEADEIRAATLHPGLRKGSLANPESGDDEGELDELGLSEWKYRGRVGDMIPVKELERILALVVRTHHERAAEVAQEIADRVQEAVTEGLAAFIEPMEELYPKAMEDDEDDC